MSEENLELAIITNLAYGYVDNQGVGMTIQIRILRGLSNIFLEASKVTEMVSDTKMDDIFRMKGMPCVVDVTDNIVTFKQLL